MIRSSASKNDISLIPLGWNTSVGLAADLHFHSTLLHDKYCMIEYMPHKLMTDIPKHNLLSLDNEGKITLPTGAGLGIELDDEPGK